MRAAWLLAGRYLVSRRRERFVAVIAGIAVAGVAVGVAALIVTLAVMTGFDQDLQTKIVGANPHLVIQTSGMVADPEAVIGRLSALPELVAVSPFVQGQVLLMAGSSATGVVLRGIDPAREPRVTELARYLVEGTLAPPPVLGPAGRPVEAASGGQTGGGVDPGADGILLGRVLAQRLGVVRGDRLQVVTPTSRTPTTLRVAGLFASGMYDYDANLAVTRVATAQTLLGLGTAVTGIGARIADPLKASAAQAAIRRALGYPYWVLTWMEQNRNLFAALKLEKVTMFLILTLIVLVACFTIVATLLMMVIERIRDIGILLALGATARTVRTVFTLVGMGIGGFGTVIGLAGGVGLCELLRRGQFVKLPPDIYYLDHLPVQMVWPDIGVIVAAAVVISWLACLYPAAVAARLNPVEALRYE